MQKSKDSKSHMSARKFVYQEVSDADRDARLAAYERDTAASQDRRPDPRPPGQAILGSAAKPAHGSALVLSLQETMLTALIFVDHAGGALVSLLEPRHFDDPYRELAISALEYHAKYGRAPGQAHVDDIFERFLNDPKEARAKLYRDILGAMVSNAKYLNPDYILDEAREFLRRQALKHGVLRFMDRWEQGGDGMVDEARVILAAAVHETGDAAIAAAETTSTWPTPLGEAAFPGLAGEIVATIDPHTEADRAALLIQVLASFGNMIGRGAWYTVEGTRHHGNIFGVVVGETAKSRKGTSWSQIHAIAKFADVRWAEDNVKSGLSSGEGVIAALRDASGNDPGVRDKRVLFQDAEFAATLKTMGREGNSLSRVLREAWDGSTLQTLTRNSPLKATRPHVSVVGHCTLEELRRNLTGTEAANGFANRFMFLLARRSKVLPEGGSLSDDDRRNLAEKFWQTVKYGRDAGELRFDCEGGPLWHKVYPSVSAGKPGMLGAITSRAEAQVVRVALLYALLDRTTLIGVVHLIAALEVWRYCEASALHTFGDALGDPIADDVLAALRGAGVSGMTRTALHGLFGRHRSAERLGAALKVLESRGLAIREMHQTTGRSAEIWKAVAATPPQRPNGPIGRAYFA